MDEFRYPPPYLQHPTFINTHTPLSFRIPSLNHAAPLFSFSVQHTVSISLPQKCSKHCKDQSINLSRHCTHLYSRGANAPFSV